MSVRFVVNVTRLTLALAFALAFLLPATARAALVPVCENRESMSLPPVAQPRAFWGDACSRLGQAPAVDDDDVDAVITAAKVAALCDVRAASIIAPQRMLPVSDGRIEAGPGCDDDSASVTIGPRSKGVPVVEHGSEVVGFAVLPVQQFVPEAWLEAATSAHVLHADRQPPRGVSRDIDHPPR